MRNWLWVVMILFLLGVQCTADVNNEKRRTFGLISVCRIPTSTLPAEFSCDAQSIVYWLTENGDKHRIVNACNAKSLLWSKELPPYWEEMNHIETDGNVVILYNASFFQGVLALDAKTGKEKWQRQLPTPANQKQPSGRTTATVTIQDGILYLLYPRGLTALEPQTGKELWHLPLQGKGGWNWYIGPLVTRARLYFSFDDAKDAHGKDTETLFVYCVNRANGKIIWKKANGVDRIYGDPPPILDMPSGCTDGKRVYFLRYVTVYPKPKPPLLVCLDGETGKEIWKRQLPWVADTKPICASGSVFVGDISDNYNYMVFDGMSGKRRGRIADGIQQLVVSGASVFRLRGEKGLVLVQWNIRTMKIVKRVAIPTTRGKVITQDLVSCGGRPVIAVGIREGNVRYTQLYQVVIQ